MCGVRSGVGGEPTGGERARFVSRKLLVHLQKASLRIAKGGEPTLELYAGSGLDQRYEVGVLKSGKVQRSSKVMDVEGVIWLTSEEPRLGR